MGKRQSRLGAEEVAELARDTHFTPKELNRWYRGFVRDCPSGALNEQDFIQIYKQFFPFGNPVGLASCIFNLFEKNSDGVVEFKQFITALSVTSRGSVEEKLKWCFTLYDKDHDGFITREEMINVIDAMYKMVGHLVRFADHNDTPKSRVKAIFDSFDIDKDGMLSMNDFMESAQTDPDIAQSLSRIEELI